MHSKTGSRTKGTTSSDALLEDGFRVFPSVVDDLTCQTLLSVASANSAGSRTMLSIPAVREIAGLLRQSFDLLREHVAIQCILFRKSAQKNWAVCVHRDRILPARSVLGGEYVGEKEGMSSYRFPDGLLHRLIIARLSLNHVPEGDIVVTPGSHDWSSANRPREKVPVFVPKGGVLLMKPLLLHGSKRLSISEERCVLHFVFAPRDLPAQWCYTA